MDDDRKFSAYMHRLNDGRVYIGITSRTLKQRWSGRGMGYRTCPHFWSAIKKYGWESFEHIEIASGLSREDAEKLEISLIAQYDSTNPERGFNILNGGNGTEKMTDEIRARMSAANKGKPKPPGFGAIISERRMGYKPSEETIAKIKAARAKQTFSAETRAKLSASHKGLKMPREGVERAAEKRRGSKHTEEAKAKMRKAKLGTRNVHSMKPVLQFSKDGTFIKRWDSAVDAHNELGVAKMSISHSANGKTLTGGGYIWRFESEAEASA